MPGKPRPDIVQPQHPTTVRPHPEVPMHRTVPTAFTLLALGGEFDVIHRFSFGDGLLFGHKELPVADKKTKFIPNGIAVHPDGDTAYVAGTWGHAVCAVDLKAQGKFDNLDLGPNSYPYGCLL